MEILEWPVAILDDATVLAIMAKMVICCPKTSHNPPYIILEVDIGVKCS